MYLVFIAKVVRCRYEDHWVNSLTVPFEGSHTGSLLVPLAQLRDIKEPGFCSLVKGGGEYEVTREKNPEEGSEEDESKTHFCILDVCPS